MSLILVVEPDSRHAAQLASMARNHLHAELVVAESGDRAVAALADRVPDIVLTAPLLPHHDETILSDYLRALGDAGAHVQTLTIPILSAPATPHRGIRGRFRRDRDPVIPDGCDPALFAEQVGQYLRRARQVRSDGVIALHAENRSESSELEPAAPLVPPQIMPVFEVMPESQEVIPQREAEVIPQREAEVIPQIEFGVSPEREEEIFPEREPEVVSEREEEIVPERRGVIFPELKADLFPKRKAEALPERKAEDLPKRKAEALPERKAEDLPKPQVEARPDNQVYDIDLTPFLNKPSKPETSSPVAAAPAPRPETPRPERPRVERPRRQVVIPEVLPAERPEVRPAELIASPPPAPAARTRGTMLPAVIEPPAHKHSDPPTANLPQVIMVPAPAGSGHASVSVAVAVSVQVAASTVSPTPPPTPTQRPKALKPVQDEWGFFDPDQCGFRALLARLDAIASTEDPQS